MTPAPSEPNNYIVYRSDTDRSSWHPKLVEFLDYWLSIKPRDALPGRRAFDPLDIPLLMPRIWMLDVLREPLRYRYRLVGTKEVELLQREVTGLFFDEVHTYLRGDRMTYGRLEDGAERSLVTYRKGQVVALRNKKHSTIENCIVPLARDGRTVDMLVTCSVLYSIDGREN